MADMYILLGLLRLLTSDSIRTDRERQLLTYESDVASVSTLHYLSPLRFTVFYDLTSVGVVIHRKKLILVETP
ncbi:uncharacterized protein C8Q71DRAFT_777649 [Rhodofomes roseus]|uniref:Uncharacterized protein n=1 Tax=Rhodofomes roseus TaxID=34475 RepID=A0ABQ8K612_9APHY|nr:uncharacterized protein C8Q71DRAFT_777649 [Rhodofomes roseus]KAH9832156.1 hypothetical protein C8Q71DRAFT_777649 [Rhodofomes roseus]